MKKKPGINGEWVAITSAERNAGTGLSTVITLGTPAAVHAVTTVGSDLGKFTWLVTLIFWIYGLMFWMTSAGRQLFRRKRWVWTEEAMEEQRFYERNKESQIFWGYWWVRFPIGLFFLSIGLYAFLLEDFMLQWISVLFLMVGFVTPFVFMMELVLLPLSVIVILALLGVVALLPTALMVMFGLIGMGVTVAIAQKRRSKQPSIKKDNKKTNAAEPAAKSAEGDDNVMQSGDVAESAEDAKPSKI
jgi:hypothetical protein